MMTGMHDQSLDDADIELPNFKCTRYMLQHDGSVQRNESSYSQLPPPSPPKPLSLADAAFGSCTEPSHEMPPHDSPTPSQLSDTQLVVSQGQLVPSSESQHQASAVQSELSASGGSKQPAPAAKSVAEMTKGNAESNEGIRAESDYTEDEKGKCYTETTGRLDDDEPADIKNMNHA